jgi:hypothetical protein
MSTSAVTDFLRGSGGESSLKYTSKGARQVGASGLAVLMVGQCQQAADGQVGLCWMAECALWAEGVARASPVALTTEVGRLGHRQVAPADRAGYKAATAGYRVRYTRAAKLVNELVEAADEKVLTKTIARYGRVDLPVLMSWAMWSWTAGALSCCSKC